MNYFERFNNQKLTTQHNYPDIIRDSNFKQWFKNSKVVDSNGDPLTVFHSTLKKEFSGDFKVNKYSAEDWSGYGVYFSSDRKATRDFFMQEYQDAQWRFNKVKKGNYSEDEKNQLLQDKEKFEKENESMVKTFNCFLKIENPLVVNNHSELMDIYYSGITREKLMEKYDGIFVKHDSDFTDQYIVFNPENIKILPSIIEI